MNNELLERASALFGFRGEVVEDVQFAGARVAVTAQIDEQEHARRQNERLGALLDRDLWEALAVLPYREEVPWRAIDPIARALIDVAPMGTVEGDAVSVSRIIRPAVVVTGVIAVDARWLRVEDRASRFSAHAPRAGVVLSSVSRHAVRRARVLGMGIASAHDQLLEVVVPSRPTRAVPGARNFRFCEVVYEAWLRTSSRSVPKP